MLRGNRKLTKLVEEQATAKHCGTKFQIRSTVIPLEETRQDLFQNKMCSQTRSKNLADTVAQFPVNFDSSYLNCFPSFPRPRLHFTLL